jgi:hypothetical protein
MRTIRDEDENDSVAFENVKVVRCTPKAMLVSIEGEDHWIPHSQIHADSEVYLDEKQALQGSPGKLVVKAWFARKEGLSE